MKRIGILILMLVAFGQINGQDKDKDKKKEKEKIEKSLKVLLKEAEGMVIIIDGKKYDREIAELLDYNKIESVTVIKGEKAEKEYNASNGVIVIKSKIKDPEIEVKNKIELRNSDGQDVEPMIILNGKEISREELGKIDPEDIDSIEVLKGEKALEKYNAENGVIIVKMKVR